MAIKLNESTGFWEVSYSKRHPITRVPSTLRRVGFKSKAEAQRAYNELVVRVEHRLHAVVAPEWEKIVSDFISELPARDLTEKTADNYAKFLRLHTSKWNDRLVDSISTQEIRDLIQRDLGELTAHTQKYVLKCIRAVFDFAVDRNNLDKNPTPKIKFKMPEKIQGVLTEDQVRAFLRAARAVQSPWYYHWALALFTGMRSGELHALKWLNVNLEENVIYVKESWNSKDGEKCTKSGKDRVVSIAPDLKVLLSELKLKSSSNYVLPRIREWDRGEQAKALQSFLRSIGLPEIRFHDLRASWATILLGKGVPAAQVQRMGGWETMDTMMIYMRKAGIDIRGATNCLNFHDPKELVGQVLNFRERS